MLTYNFAKNNWYQIFALDTLLLKIISLVVRSSTHKPIEAELSLHLSYAMCTEI